jgi:NADPH-dependent curcumin reductase CurA
MKSREIRFARRPAGWPAADTYEYAEVDVPPPRAGEATVRNIYMSVDPYMRGRMNDMQSYVPGFRLGAPLEGTAIGQVVASESSLAVGSFVSSACGWRDAFTAREETLTPIDPELAPLSAYLGVLGLTGFTAYVGLVEIASLRSGDEVFISSAAGAVGSAAGQFAKLRGARTIGSAGSPDKVAFLREIGFDDGFDYHDGDLVRRLKAFAPHGISLYFDNVGGDQLTAALSAMRDFGRIVVCGMIAGYNEPLAGPDNLALLIARRLTMRGFIVIDHLATYGDFVREFGPAVRDGRIGVYETIVEGLENAPQALLDVLRGGNHRGKLLVQLAPDPTRA